MAPQDDLAGDVWRRVIDEDPGLHDLEPETVRRIASAVLRKAADVALPRDRASRRPMLYEQVQSWLYGVADEFGSRPTPDDACTCWKGPYKDWGTCDYCKREAQQKAAEWDAPPLPNEPRSTLCVDCSHGAVWHLLGSHAPSEDYDPSCKFSGCECPNWRTESDVKRARELLDQARVCMMSTHTYDNCTCRPPQAQMHSPGVRVVGQTADGHDVVLGPAIES